MSDDTHHELLLGKATPVVEEYAPQLLYPIPRSRARESLGFNEGLSFSGADLWHAYEMSWLNKEGTPVVRVGRFLIPCSSPYMVESKSFKLYLNSLNNTRFNSDEFVRKAIVQDIGNIAGTSVELELLPVDSPELSGQELAGHCLDELAIEVEAGEPSAQMLQTDTQQLVEETLYSHLLRSLCPVTGQPDWATVWIHYRGRALEHKSLLRYIVSYRSHQEFHEQCVERMFRDISSVVAPKTLSIQAFYTRRGGMDINPFRSSDPGQRPLPRIDRQ